MPDVSRGPWPVRTVEGSETREATARLLDDALLLEHSGGVSVIELASLTGLAVAGETVTLWQLDAGPLALTAPGHAAEIADAVGDATCHIPELTAGLRALGSPRALPGSDHDRFFAPLLSARRAAHAAAGPAARVDAFDGDAIATAMNAALVAFSEARFPHRAPDQRALLEELREQCEPVWRALGRVDEAAAAAQPFTGETRFQRWRAWLGSVREAFERADASWQDLLPALADSRGRSGRLWRRVIRTGGTR